MALLTSSWDVDAAALAIFVGSPIAILLHHIVWNALLKVMDRPLNEDGLRTKFDMK